MSTFSNTFKPQDIDQEVDQFGRPIDVVQDSVDSLEATSLDVPTPTPTPAPALVKEEAETSTTPTLDKYRGSAQVEEPKDSLTPTLDKYRGSLSSPQSTTTTPTLDKYRNSAGPSAADYNRADSLLPEGIAPKSYSADDISENDDLYSIVYKYMDDRYGIQSLEGVSRKNVVEKFLNNRRGVYMSNSIRSLAETDYLIDVRNNPERMEKAGRAYNLYQQMADITSDEVSWSEVGDASVDVIRTLVLDPINLVTFGIGKVVGGTATRAGIKTLETFVMREVRSRIAAGISKEVIEKSTSEIFKKAAVAVAAEGGEEVAKFAAQMAAKKGLSRITTQAGVREIAASTVVDAIAGSGFEYLYQNQLVDTEVQDEVNRHAVGLAAVAAIGMGVLVGAKVATRGLSDTALVSRVVKDGDPKSVADDLTSSMQDYFKKEIDDGSSWASKVNTGEELNVQDTEFFIDLLLGVSDKEGSVIFKGLAQSMQEGGFYFAKRDDQDKLSNFVADFISEMGDDSVRDIVKVFEKTSGTKLTGMKEVVRDGVSETLDEVTAESFSNAFAKKMSNSARSMNSASQVAKRLSIDVADMDVEQYLSEALGMGLMGPIKAGDNSVSRGIDMIAAGQNRFIRTLVSHPSTSILNVMGYGVSSTMGSANDILRGTMHLGAGTVQSLIGMSNKGVERKRIGMALLKANANRINLVLDSDMTQAAYKSALLRSTGALSRLGRVQAGGVDTSKSMKAILGETKAGKVAETYVEAMQTATFVQAQDTMTKAQEYVFQMDKALRITFNKSWNEFYVGDDAAKIMATKEYQLLEQGAVGKVMEHTFSKSYKGTGLLGEVAGAIEDVRNIPGLGMMIPFGRFFNNTIDFTVKNTPGVNTIAKLAGKYPDKTHGELVTQGMIAGGLVYAMAGNEQEKRRQGLGMYDSVDPLTGEVFSQQYDYPLSLFIAGGRYLSYHLAGETPPKELVAQLGKDFGGGGLTRNLSTTGGVVIDAFEALLMGEMEKAGDLFSESIGGIGAQAIGGFTRPLEPLDAIVGLVVGTEMRPQNVKDGNSFLGKALTYVDNMTQAFTGEPFNDVRVSSAQGEMDAQTTKNLAARIVRNTDALRIMNVMAFDSWDLNASYRASKMVAGAANEFNRMMFEEMDRVASGMMNDTVFRNSTTEKQREAWKSAVSVIRERARARLAYEYTGAQSTFADMLTITDKYSPDLVSKSLDELNYPEDLGDLDYGQMALLQSRLETQADIDTYFRDATVNVNP